MHTRRLKALRQLAVIVLAWCLSALPATAEDYRLNVIVELPSGDPTPFESAWQALRDTLQSRGYPFYTVVSASGTYRHFVSVIGDYAALETVAGFRDSLLDQPDGDLQKALEQFRQNSLSVQSYITRHDRELSYAPAPFPAVTDRTWAGNSADVPGLYADSKKA